MKQYLLLKYNIFDVSVELKGEGEGYFDYKLKFALKFRFY